MSEAAFWRTIDEEAGVWSLTYPSSGRRESKARIRRRLPTAL